MKTHIFFRNLLLSLYIIVIFFQAYFKEGSLISQLSTVLIILISIIYFVKCLFLKNKRFFLKTWTVFLLLNILSFVFTATYSDSKHYGTFLGILITFFSFYPFYYFTLHGYFQIRQLRIFLLLLIPVIVYSFYSTQSRLLMDRLVNDTNVVNNISYSFVALMPVVFLIRKKIYSIGTLIFLIIFIVQGAKRGAIISSGLIVIVYFYYLLRNTKKGNNSIRLIGVMMLILALIYFGYTYYLSNEFLIDRMSRISGGSGRDKIYQKILNYWYDSDDMLKYFFGFGFVSSLKITNGLFAHNDWLELLSNIGLVGILCYLLLYFSSIRVFREYKWESVEKYILLSVILVWLLSSMVSMWYSNTQGYIYSILLAYLVAKKKRNY